MHRDSLAKPAEKIGVVNKVSKCWSRKTSYKCHTCVVQGRSSHNVSQYYICPGSPKDFHMPLHSYFSRVGGRVYEGMPSHARGSYLSTISTLIVCCAAPFRMLVTSLMLICLCPCPHFSHVPCAAVHSLLSGAGDALFMASCRPVSCHTFASADGCSWKDQSS